MPTASFTTDFHKQPDSGSLKSLNMNGIELNDDDFAKFGLKSPQQVIEFFKSPQGKQLKNSIILELEEQKFFQETISMEQAERKQLFLSMMAACLFKRAEAREHNTEEALAAEALLRFMLTDEHDNYHDALEHAHDHASEAYTPEMEEMRDLCKDRTDLYNIERELDFLNELEDGLKDLEEYITEKENKLEEKTNNALKNMPDDATEEEKEAERLKTFEQFVKDEFQKELGGLDNQVNQTSEAKSTEPSMENSSKPMPKPQNEREKAQQKQSLGKLKQAFAKHMLDRVNQVAAPGEQPRADLAAQANMNINPEQFRSNITNHHTTVRERFDAFRNGLSDTRKSLNNQATVTRNNINKHETTIDNNLKKSTEFKSKLQEEKPNAKTLGVNVDKAKPAARPPQDEAPRSSAPTPFRTKP